MDKLKTYLKGLTKDEQKALADQVSTSAAYLWQIAYKQRLCREKLAIEIEKATSRAVCVEDLRPDVDWAYLRQSENPSEHFAASDDTQPPAGTPKKRSKRKT